MFSLLLQNIDMWQKLKTATIFSEIKQFSLQNYPLTSLHQGMFRQLFLVKSRWFFSLHQNADR